MRENIESCLICGAPLKYLPAAEPMECSLCRRIYASNARCVNGHFICDACHARQGLEVIRRICGETSSRNPFQIMEQIMNDPYIYMHGPEHHVLAGAALLAAYKNSGGKTDFSPALKEMFRRGAQVPGGTCGFWGGCGAALSSGIFISIITGATPLTVEPWALANKMTSLSLAAMAEIGGPRCCKRNCFIAAREAVYFLREHLGVSLEAPEKITCAFTHRNQECLGRRCPYHPSQKSTDSARVLNV